MPGPPPQPIERKRRLGNPGHESLPAPETMLPAPRAADPHGNLPAAPDSLGDTGASVWRQALALGDRWIAATDLRLLTRYCEALDEREELQALVAANGLLTTGSQGQDVIHPAYKALKDLDKDLTKYEGLLGFTPADRTRIGVAEVREVSALEAFLGGD